MRILIADDDPDHRTTLQMLLHAWEFDPITASDGASALHFIQEDRIRLAILDRLMPRLDGLQVCREVRKLRDRPYTYILLLTALRRTQDIVSGLESGADDYLAKPYNAEELRARLYTGRRMIELQDQLVAAHEALREQASRDPLTGLLNRGAILDLLHRELARADREGRGIGVLLADLDHFKWINDTFGHLTGDQALREVGRRIREGIRPYDGFGRYGGEEFLMVLPGCDAAATAGIAERLRRCIGDRPMDLPDGLLPVTVSVGAAFCGSPSLAMGETLLRMADTALYQAKRAGRNRVEYTHVEGRAPVAAPTLS